MKNVTLASCVIGLLAIAGAAQHQVKKDTMEDCPMHGQHMAEMTQRGDKAMGFDHMKTTHHFRLLRDGGAIEVTANDSGDVTSRDQIRRHLAEIAKMFKAGDFEKPLAVHGQVPPGANEMGRLRNSISYTFEEIERGGRVRIQTRMAEALAAVHAFLKFQIAEHQTGDSLDPERVELEFHSTPSGWVWARSGGCTPGYYIPPLRGDHPVGGHGPFTFHPFRVRIPVRGA